MAEILKRNKPLSVSPLKASQTMGAALAFLGLNRCMPLMHGSQGCTAFAKVFFVRHFREPIPLQTTAMEQISSVMGADDNIVEALRAIAEKSGPSVIGLVTTGLAETQGCNIQGALKEFRQSYPQYHQIEVVAVNTPDYIGCFESGYALGLKAIIETLVPESLNSEDIDVTDELSSTEKPGSSDRPNLSTQRTLSGQRTLSAQQNRQVNVLCHANLTPGDLEYIADTIEGFNLTPLFIPDLSGSLDGHLPDEYFNPLTTGGVSVEALQTSPESIATLVIGDSIDGAADSLSQRTGLPDYRFSHLMSVDAVDRWLAVLADISQQAVPGKWQRHRQQLLDAMLDTHFMIGTTRYCMAADVDLLIGFEAMLDSMGAKLVGAVIPAKAKAASKLGIASVQIGDMEDLEGLAKTGRAQLIIGNSHAVDSAKRLHLPMLRAGFPQYDYLGGFQRVWCGYQGIRNALFEIANLLSAHHAEIPEYHSIYSQKSAEPEKTSGAKKTDSSRQSEDSGNPASFQQSGEFSVIQ